MVVKHETLLNNYDFCGLKVRYFHLDKTDSDSNEIVESNSRRLIKQITINNTANDMKIKTCQLLCTSTI